MIRHFDPSTSFQVTALRLRRGITLTLALSHDGRGDKRAFDRLRPNVLLRGHTAVTDTPAWPQTRGVTLLRVNGVPVEAHLFLG